jgi:sulfotransferase family protein
MNQNAKIFGIGLSRTGTLSLTKALTTLGFKTKHYPNDKATQDELRRGSYRLSLLNEVQALTDIPVSPYYAQFDRLYPGSRFILTTRATDAWLTSIENHFRLYVEQRRDDFDDFVCACVYGTLHFSADRFRYVKELHEANVRRYFADRAGDLLVLNIAEGDDWKVLCDFLETPIPSEPFPHENIKRSRPATRRTAAPSRRDSLVRRLLGILK